MSRKRKILLPIPTVVIFGIGLLVFLGGYVWRLKVLDFLDHAIEVDGIVVAFENREGGDSSMVKLPVVKFGDFTGTRYEFTSRFGTNPPRYEIGDRVMVLFDPRDEDPRESAEISSELSLFFGSWLLMGMGGVGMVLGVVSRKFL